jgi:hypothetical protein
MAQFSGAAARTGGILAKLGVNANAPQQESEVLFGLTDIYAERDEKIKKEMKKMDPLMMNRGYM